MKRVEEPLWITLNWNKRVTFNQEHYFSFSIPLGSHSNFAVDRNFCQADRQRTLNYFCHSRQ
jgi:hypothetical protein